MTPCTVKHAARTAIVRDSCRDARSGLDREGRAARYDRTAVTELSWNWIALLATVPPILALAGAWPFWRKRQPIFGNLVGTAVIFGSAFALIMREYVEIDRITQACLDEGMTCFPEPSAFTRFAIYAFIGLFEVFMLFLFSIRIEERIRRQDYAPEWR